MRKIIFGFIGFFAVCFTNLALGQGFTVQSDTVWITNPSGSYFDKITNTTSSNIVLKWNVIASNFPPDWLYQIGSNVGLGVCDNHGCYANIIGDTSIWNGYTSNGSTFITNDYAPGVLSDFHIVLSPTSTSSSGTYYLAINIQEDGAVSSSRRMVFVVTKTTAVPTVNNPSNEVSLYPNPAYNEVNLVYDANADVKTIALYNIIGKVIAVYKVTTGNSANLNLENVPSGMYFAKLINAQGEIVNTRKFTKQ